MSCFRSRFVAAMRRTSTRMVLMPPTRSNSDSWIARRSFTCISTGTSPISSRKSVPPSASSKRPGFEPTAPVNAPRSYPNSSLSTRSFGMAAQFTLMSGLSRLHDDLVDRLDRGGLAHEGRALAVGEVGVDVLALEIVGARRLGDDVLQVV